MYPIMITHQCYWSLYRLLFASVCVSVCLPVFVCMHNNFILHFAYVALGLVCALHTRFVVDSIH